jgi:ribosomal protein S12 methylthiotransferase accessory factor
MSPTATQYRRGTHRLRPPEETWEWCQPAAVQVGVTRVADITWLDDSGIPVVQAIRPTSKNLCVSSGKGLTPMLAKVSAVMEAIELYHGENVDIASERASVTEMRGHIDYDPLRLDHPNPSLLNAETVLSWIPAVQLDNGAATFAPYEFVNLDATGTDRWDPPLLLPSGKGLASGNSLAEATLHALCELVEGDGVDNLYRTPRSQWRCIDIFSVDGEAASLIDRLHRTGNVVTVLDVTSDVGVPCFYAVVWSHAFPTEAQGAGCHPDRDVALCRAITEAVQQRLAIINGTRDSLRGETWKLLERGSASIYQPPGSGKYFPLASISNSFTGDLTADTAKVVASVMAHTRQAPLAVELTRNDMQIPVVKVIAPGLATEVKWYQ